MQAIFRQRRMVLAPGFGVADVTLSPHIYDTAVNIVTSSSLCMVLGDVRALITCLPHGS